MGNKDRTIFGETMGEGEIEDKELFDLRTVDISVLSISTTQRIYGNQVRGVHLRTDVKIVGGSEHSVWQPCPDTSS